MIERPRPRGGPLIALAAILVLWIGGRVALWDWNVPGGTVGIPALAQTIASAEAASRSAKTGATKTPVPSRRAAASSALAVRVSERSPAGPAARARARPSGWSDRARIPGPLVARSSAPELLYPPEHPRALSAPAIAPYYPAGREPRDRSRWSVDAWILVREGGNASVARGAAPATYGASQAGGVLRYRLAPQSARRPAAYLRASAALNGSREREAALGLSARVLPPLPLVAAAELRASSQPGDTRLRPAVFAVTELPPFEVPVGLRAETYAQAGYVGGRFATAFVDGQLKVDRRVVHAGAVEVRAGGGLWGGAQKDASRLDIGPSVSMALTKGASARVAFDWRFRIAGNAAPSSGPAFTMSAGF